MLNDNCWFFLKHIICNTNLLQHFTYDEQHPTIFFSEILTLKHFLVIIENLRYFDLKLNL